MIQQYLTFKYSLHSGVPIKQVGGPNGAPKEHIRDLPSIIAEANKLKTQTTIVRANA